MRWIDTAKNDNIHNLRITGWQCHLMMMILLTMEYDCEVENIVIKYGTNVDCIKCATV